MVQNCVVRGCDSKWYPGGDIKFHPFPKNKTQRKLWLSIVPLKIKFYESARICNLHFQESDYEYYDSGTIRLKKTAVPAPTIIKEETAEKKAHVPVPSEPKTGPSRDIVAGASVNASTKKANVPVPSEPKTGPSRGIEAGASVNASTKATTKSTKMVMCCAVSGCKRESYPGCGITFHRIPPKRRESWIEAMKLDSKISVYASVCGLHFKDEDYITGLKSKLKPDAVPSILNPKLNPFLYITPYIVGSSNKKNIDDNKLSEKDSDSHQKNHFYSDQNDNFDSDATNCSDSDENNCSDSDKNKYKASAKIKFEGVCRTCLCNDRKLYDIPADNQFIFKDVLIKDDPLWIGELPRRVCWECNARMTSFTTFKTKAMQAIDSLVSLIRPKSNSSPDISSINRSALNLTSTLMTKTFQANHVDYKFKGNDEEESPDQGICVPFSDIEKIDPYIMNYTNAESDDEIVIEKLPKPKVKKSCQKIKQEKKKQLKTVTKEELNENQIDPYITDYTNAESDDEIAVEKLPKLIVKKSCQKIKQEKKKQLKTIIKEELDEDKIDPYITDYTNAESDDEIVIEKLPKLKVKKSCQKIKQEKKKQLKTVIKEELNENKMPADLNAEIFNLTYLSPEEQKNEINNRKNSDNYLKSGFKCDLCFKGFIYEDAFNLHMIKHTDEFGPLPCGVCKIHYMNKRDLQRHMLYHTLRFSCKKCTYVTPSKHAAKLHVQYHSGTEYVCPYCFDTFLKKTTYLNHIRIKHSEIVCFMCGYSFVSNKGLLYHMKRKHRFDDRKVPIDGPWCLICNIQFFNSEALEKHVQISSKHTKDTITSRKPFAQRLRRHYSSQENIARERKNAIGKASEPINCEQCDMQLPNARAYFVHFRREHPDKNRTKFSTRFMTMCEVCGRMCQSKAALRNHSFSHTESKQFQCTICDKKFVREAGLVTHERLIHGDKRTYYSCNICSKNFASVASMKTHQFIHTGLRPYQCEICGKTFKSMRERRAHITYVHLRKPWPKRVRVKREKSKQNQAQATKLAIIKAKQAVKKIYIIRSK